MGDPSEQEGNYGFARESIHISEIFDAVTELPPPQRQDYLDRRCGRDSPLRAEVERLLKHHDRVGLLDRTPGIGKSSSDTQPSSVRPLLAEGDLLANRFRIHRLIGSGGMGTVYEAEDLTTALRVALKTIRAGEMHDDRLAARLRKEMRIARNVGHPNVCKVFEYWEYNTPEFGPLTFFTMELLHGETLAQRIASRGRLNSSEALKILRQVAAGLTEVHRLGIVHRDLKPANIFLVRQADGTDRAVVMDFGLARNLADGATQTGMFMGTPPYMAPEQFEGGSVSVATDVYAFGVVAFELVTGVNHPLVAPRSIVGGLTPAWDRTLLRCFTRDPALRPASAERVVSMLQERARPWGLWGGVAGALTLALGMGIAWRTWSASSGVAEGAAQITFDDGFTADPASSADGKLLVYASDRGGRGDLNIWSQRMDTGETMQLTSEPADEDEPAISPDGKLLAYRVGSKNSLHLKAIPGGVSRFIAHWAEAPRFSPDGQTLAYWSGHSSALGQIWLVPVAGGAPRRLAREFADARFPVWSPDGKTILFRGSRSAFPTVQQNREWWIADPGGQSYRATGAARRLATAGVTPHDSPVAWDGSRVVFSAANRDSTNLWRLNLFSLMQWLPASPQLITSGAGFQVVPAILADGRVAFADWRREIHIWMIDPSSAEMDQVTTRISKDARVSSSADGRTLAFVRLRGGSSDVWMRDMRSGNEQQLVANEPAVPHVSPSGRTVAMSVGREISLFDLSTKTRQTICTDCGEILDWMPDESAVLYLETQADGRQALKLHGVSGTERTRVLLEGRGFHSAALSPDGSSVAFTLREDSMHSRVMAARIPPHGPAISWTAITDNETWSERPVWSEDGRTIYYVTDRDGFWCTFAQTVQRVTLKPAGASKALRHLHAATTTLSHLVDASSGMARGGGKIFLCVGSERSNIWAVKP